MTITTVTTAPAEVGPGLSSSLAQQLEGLVRLLRSKPELPVNPFSCTTVQYDAESAAEVDAIAEALCIPASWNRAGTHYRAEYKIGQEVSYLAIFITPSHMDAYREHMAAFRPEGQAAA